MPSHPDEHDDAFFTYVGELVLRNQGLEKMLTFIRDHLGHVCPQFEMCSHTACNDSCTAWLVADAALKGVYVLPGEKEAPGPVDDRVPTDL